MSARHQICVLPGDGIGPEVTQAAIRVLEARGGRATGSRSSSTSGCSAARRSTPCGDPFPDDTREACLAADAVLLGAVGGPRWDSGAGAARAGPASRCARRCRLLRQPPPRPPLVRAARSSPLRARARRRDSTSLIVRELIGGLYFGERGLDDDGAYDTCSYSADEIRRIVASALPARRSPRAVALTSVDKANVLDTSQALAPRRDRGRRPSTPTSQLEHQLVDSMAMKLSSSRPPTT